MKRKTALFLTCVLALASLGGLASLQTLQPVKGETNYTKTISLSASLFTTTQNHPTLTLNVGGIAVSYTSGVYNPNNTQRVAIPQGSGYRIAFPAVDTSVSGPHGTGYQSIFFDTLPSRLTNYLTEAKIIQFNAENTSQERSVPLSTSESTTFTLDASYRSYFQILAGNAGTGSTLYLTGFSVTYGCANA